MRNKLANVFDSAENSQKLIHCITNPISVNMLANGILALGCRPIMAEHPAESAEITASAAALLLNCGNITDARIRSMKISAKTASNRHIPIVLDAVGTACSKLRRRFALKLIRRYHPTVIKGNYSEIFALYRKGYKTGGIDGDPALDRENIAAAAKFLAAEFSCVVLASGKVDIITDGCRCVGVCNGTEMLPHITGTGCLLGAVTAAMISGGETFIGTVAACGVLGTAGERIPNGTPNGSFAVKLIDELSEMTAERLISNLRTEEIL